MLVLQRLTNEYIASIRKTLRAAKQDDCSRLLRLREQQTLPLPDTNGVT